ncbi:MAG: hypothetical protein GY851_27070 [bacterium]|nr:hypothetical protein [bacterium]
MKHSIACIGALLAATVTFASLSSHAVTMRTIDEDGEPVVGASVYVLYPSGDWAVDYRMLTEGRTDRQGRFSFAPLRGKNWLAAARAPGHAVASRGWKHAKSPGDMHDFDLVLPEERTFAGRVTDNTGSPIENAVVSPCLFYGTPYRSGLLWNSAILSTRTGAKGRFVLHGVPKGPVPELRAMHPDYATALWRPGYQQTTSCEKLDETIVIEPIVMEGGHVITGTITFEDTGKPAPGAWVQRSISLGKSWTPTWVETVITDEEGRYTMHVPHRYRHRYRVTHSEAPYRGSGSNLDVKVPPYGPSVGADLALERGVPVSGRFINADTGDPIPGDRIWAAFAESHHESELPVEQDGTFTAYVQRYDRSIRGRCVFGGYDVPFAVSFGRIEGESRTDIVIKVAPPKLVRGKVLKPDGQPFVGAVVTAPTEQVWHPSCGVFVSTDGSFEIPVDWWLRRPANPTRRRVENSPPALKLIAKYWGMPDCRTELDLGPYDLANASTLQNRDIVLYLEPTAELRGRILYPSGRPVQGGGDLGFVRR